MARANVIIHECRRTPASNTSSAASGYASESERRPACACETRWSMLATWPASAAMNSAVEPYRSRVLGRRMRTAAWLNPLRLLEGGKSEPDDKMSASRALHEENERDDDEKCQNACHHVNEKLDCVLQLGVGGDAPKRAADTPTSRATYGRSTA